MEHKRQLEQAERELERAKKMREGAIKNREHKLGGGGYGISMLSSPSAPSKPKIKVRFADDDGANARDVQLEMGSIPKSALKSDSEHV